MSAIVALRGDEMAATMWDLVLDALVRPGLADLASGPELIELDLSLGHRDATQDRVTREAAAAVRKHGVAVKCSTVTPTAQRVSRDGLSGQWPSPNGTLRKALDGVLFREPLAVPGLPRPVPGWNSPIVMARHAHADQYAAQQLHVPGPGRVTLSYTPADGAPVERTVHEFGEGGGMAMGMYNTHESVTAFARAAFSYALARGLDVYLSTKNTVLSVYDGAYKDAVETVFAEEFEDAFRAAGLSYEHRLIDDMVAFALKGHGGFLWACKNYDGDVLFDIVAQGFGSPGLMTSVLVGRDGVSRVYEAAHGTVARHHRRREAGEVTSTNPVATIIAWARALGHRAELDAQAGEAPDAPALQQLAQRMEQAVVDALAAGVVTAELATGDQAAVTTEEFIDAVRSRLFSGAPR